MPTFKLNVSPDRGQLTEGRAAKGHSEYIVMMKTVDIYVLRDAPPWEDTPRNGASG